MKTQSLFTWLKTSKKPEEIPQTSSSSTQQDIDINSKTEATTSEEVSILCLTFVSLFLL